MNDEYETGVERYLDEAVSVAGGVSRPIIGRGWRGCSDRLVAFPYNRLFLVETKRPSDGRIKIHQQLDAEFWAQVGVIKVFLFSCKEVRDWVQRVKA